MSLKCFSLLFLLPFLTMCQRSTELPLSQNLKNDAPTFAQTRRGAIDGSQVRVMYLDSYHEGYQAGALQRVAFAADLAATSFKPQILWHFMNSQQVNDQQAIDKAARIAKERIDNYQPDILVVSDDTAMRTVIAPFFRKGPMPVVFIGVNWDAEPYKLDYSWVCGQLEVDLIKALSDQLVKIKPNFEPALSKDKVRMAILTGDTETDRKTVEYYKRYLSTFQIAASFVVTFESWKSSFLALQKTEDIIILRSNNGITGWNPKDAISFVAKNGRIPSGSVSDWMSNVSLLTYGKDNAEFGHWAAEAVVRLLQGETPPSIGIVANYNAKVKVNLGLANGYGVTVSPQVLDLAELVGRD